MGNHRIGIEMFSTVVEKIGSVGVVVSAMGCAACFPALGALAGTLGLGFLAQFEGVFINKLLPAFAILVLIANTWGWLRHRVHIRGLISILGPVAVLATLYPLWSYGWSTTLFYVALATMFAVSIIDIVKPAKRRTADV